MQKEKWQETLEATPLWLLQTFAGVLAVSALLAFLLARTGFGGQLFRVLAPCIDRRNGRKIMAAVAVLLVLLLLEVRFSVLNTHFYNGLYTALQDQALQAFWFFALMNAGLLAVRIVNGLVDEFLGEVLQIRWMERFNRELVERWMSGKHYHRLQMRRPRPDNIDQRIQQDAQDFIRNTVEFVRGMIDSVVSAIEFSIVLWGLSGVMVVFGLSISHGMVFFVFVFVLLATTLAMWIGYPLIRLNFENERLNGNYRYALIRVREHAESIAFFDGEATEKQHLHARFREVVDNRWRIVWRTLGLNTFNSGVSKGVQLLPLMLQAPRFFAGDASIGDMHQTVQAFNRLQRALSFFRNFYEKFTAYQARLERLNGFLLSLESPPAVVRPVVDERGNAVVLEDVSVFLPDGKPLLQNLSMQVFPGEALLLQGASGCGKTSLLRALAGLWPYDSTGKIVRPPRAEMLFVPQRPYMPQGTLQAALCYPHAEAQAADLAEVMRDCRLAHLIPCLHDSDDWQQRLSPGELQRIAFARVLIQRPCAVLLDEATSALDEPTEAALYALLRERLPDSIVVSIGHRNTLSAFHTRTVRVDDLAFVC